MPRPTKNKIKLLALILTLIIIAQFLAWPTNSVSAQTQPWMQNGKFIPLTSEQTATLTPDQKSAYDKAYMANIETPSATGQTGADVTTQKVNDASALMKKDDSKDLYVPLVFHIIYIAVFLITWFLKKMVYLGGSLAESVLNYTTFTNVSIVQKGWAITRGLCNMLFALVLLIMSFATILRIEEFSVKKLLPKVIIALLLINFSLLIGGVLIDFSQVMTNYFLDAIKGTNNSITDQIMTGLNVTQLFNQSDITTWQAIQKAIMGPSASMILEQLMQAIILLITAFVFFAFGFFLLARIVALWLLLIFAPFAWLSYAAGGAAGLWKKWWDNFIKWAFFAPIYSFFLYLALLIPQSKILVNENAMSALKPPFTSGFFQDPAYFLQFIVMVIILVAGLYYAQSTGIVGAKAIASWGTKMAKKPGEWAGAGAKFGAGAAGTALANWLASGAQSKSKVRKFGAYLVPDVWKQAIEQRRTQKKAESRPVAYGAAHDFLNRFIPIDRSKTDYKERAQRTARAEQMKNVQGNNAEELAAGFERAKKDNNGNLAAAYFQKLAAQNDQNELFKLLNRRNAEAKARGEKGWTNYNMDAEGMVNFVEEQILPLMKNDRQSAYRFGQDITRNMEDNGQWIGRVFNYDDKTGKYALRGAPEGKDWKNMSQAEKDAICEAGRGAALVEWKKQDPQRQINNTGRFSYIRENYVVDDKGEIEVVDGGLTKEGKERVAKLEPSQANRMQSHSKDILFFNHARELAELNPALYKELMEKTYQKSVQDMDDKQFVQYIKSQSFGIANAEGIIVETDFIDPETGQKFKVNKERKEAIDRLDAVRQRAQTEKIKSAQGQKPEQTEKSSGVIIKPNLEEEARQNQKIIDDQLKRK